MKQKRAAIYVRVSTFWQRTDPQESSLRDYVQRRGWSIHRVYRDHGVSGIRATRPGLDELMSDCRRRKVDVVVVWKFDRFARSVSALVSALDLFRKLGIDFVSFTEAIDTSIPAGELVFHFFAAVAQFERSLISERVKAGLVHARTNGIRLGRRPLRELSKADVQRIRWERKKCQTPYRALALQFGTSVWTVHRLCHSQG